MLNLHFKLYSKNLVFGKMNNSIEIYRSQDGSIQLNVKLENDTVWLNRQQMAELFGRDKTVITRHINNCFKEHEVDLKVGSAKFALPMEHGAIQGKIQIQHVTYYNLDVIISVGYRVKSLQGTRFRQWATSVLRQYLIKGYAINQQMKLDRYKELKDVVRLMSRTVDLQEKVTSEEYGGLFNVISDYVYALDTLDHYDYQSLSIQKTTKQESFRATYENAMEAINALKDKFGGSQWFANEKDDSFKSSIGQIYQTFGGEELYPSVEEKAAMLLYLVVKNHSFSDGNKRNSGYVILVVPQQQPCSLFRGWSQAYCRQHPCCPYIDDSRE